MISKKNIFSLLCALLLLTHNNCKPTSIDLDYLSANKALVAMSLIGIISISHTISCILFIYLPLLYNAVINLRITKSFLYKSLLKRRKITGKGTIKYKTISLNNTIDTVIINGDIFVDITIDETLSDCQLIIKAHKNISDLIQSNFTDNSLSIKTTGYYSKKDSKPECIIYLNKLNSISLFGTAMLNKISGYRPFDHPAVQKANQAAHNANQALNNANQALNNAKQLAIKLATRGAYQAAHKEYKKKLKEITNYFEKLPFLQISCSNKSKIHLLDIIHRDIILNVSDNSECLLHKSTTIVIVNLKDKANVHITDGCYFYLRRPTDKAITGKIHGNSILTLEGYWPNEIAVETTGNATIAISHWG